MSLTPLDPHAVRAAAQAALDARLGLIDAIVAAQNERTVAASKVAEAQAAERAAAATELSAVDGGWSVPELRKAGLKVPTSAAAGKKSTTTASAKSSPRPPRLQPSSSAAKTDTDTAGATGTDEEQNSSGESYANAS
jgi:hypothetical protein